MEPRPEYWPAIAQVLPVLGLALVIEFRLLTKISQCVPRALRWWMNTSYFLSMLSAGVVTVVALMALAGIDAHPVWLPISLLAAVLAASTLIIGPAYSAFLVANAYPIAKIVAAKPEILYIYAASWYAKRRSRRIREETERTHKRVLNGLRDGKVRVEYAKVALAEIQAKLEVGDLLPVRKRRKLEKLAEARAVEIADAERSLADLERSFSSRDKDALNRIQELEEQMSAGVLRIRDTMSDWVAANESALINAAAKAVNFELEGDSSSPSTARVPVASTLGRRSRGPKRCRRLESVRNVALDRLGKLPSTASGSDTSSDH